MKYLIFLSLFLAGCKSSPKASSIKSRYQYMDTFNVTFDGFFKNCSGKVRVKELRPIYKMSDDTTDIAYLVTATCKKDGIKTKTDILIYEQELGQ